MANNLHPGEIRMKLETEETVWMDRKRVTIFALPISFTKYELTATRLVVNQGLINVKEEEIMLYRVRDMSLTQSVFERINNTGTIYITSTDATAPIAHLTHIKDPHKVKTLLSHLVEQCRTKQRVRTTELMDHDTDEDLMDDDNNETTT